MRGLGVLLVCGAVAACGGPGEGPGPGPADAGGDLPPAAAPAGLGAQLEPGGVVFRLWAPHAAAARVTGQLPGAPVEMTAQGDGIFEAHAPGAGAGDVYAYALETAEGAVLPRLDPYCRQLAGDGCAIVDPTAYAWQAPPLSRPAREQTVVYELHVGGFTTDPALGHGTFATLRDALPGLADLGVDAVELMPVQSFGGGASGWGYDPQLYLAPKPSYGTADELRGLVDRAHALGLGVWLDMVVNHMDGWRGAPLRCFDAPCLDGGSGIYFFPPGDYAATPWGPRPHYAEPHVAAMLLDGVRWWIDEVRGDGVRWDSVSNVRALDGSGETPGGRALLVAANDLLHARGALSVAEDLKGDDAITSPAAAGGFGFDAQWDGFGYAVTGELIKASDAARDLGPIIGALTGASGGDPFARLLYLENHDTVGNDGARLTVRIDAADPGGLSARRRALLGAVLLLTAPGVPMIFMGEEQLASAGFDDPPAPLPAPDAAGLGGRAFYRDLIRLRRDLDGKTGGLLDPEVEILHRNDDAKALAYRRHGPSGQDVLVLINLRDQAYTEYDIGVDDPGPWTIRLTTDDPRYGADFPAGPTGTVTARAEAKDGKPYTLPLTVGAYGAVLLSR